MIGPLAQIIGTANSFQNVLRYFCNVRRKSNLCILRFDWLIALYIFTPLPPSCVREELSDVVFFLQTQLQQITVQEPLFVEFAFAPLTFGSCTSPTDTFPFAYHFPPVSIPISKPLNRSPICAEDDLQRFQRQINIFINYCWRRCSHFRFPYTLQSSGNFLWCRETEKHNHLLLVGSLTIQNKMAQDAMKMQGFQDVSVEDMI